MDARMVRLEEHHEKRGTLRVLEGLDRLPFSAKRIFLIEDVPPNTLRGEHAHRQCHQTLIAIKGAFEVSVSTPDRNWKHFQLLAGGPALYIPVYHWLKLENKSIHESSLLVLASHQYDENDYLRDYEEFCRAGDQI